MKKFTFFLIALCCSQVFSQITITKDLSFASSGSFSIPFSTGQSVTRSNTTILADHSILQIVGTADNDFIYKLKPDGTPDATFADNGKLELGVNNFLNAVPQGDKLIVYFGPKSTENGNYLDSKIVRYNSDGILDPSFGVNGVLNEVTESTNPQALSVLVLADHSLIVVNSNETYPKKYTANGQLDTNYAPNGEIIYNYHFPIGQFPTGKIATCDIGSLSSSVFSFFDLNSLPSNTVIDLNNYSCHQLNGVPLQNKTNISTRICSDGFVFSLFEYQTNPAPNFSRLIVMKNEQLHTGFNGEGFVSSGNDEQFMDAGHAQKIFVVLKQKANQKSLNAYSDFGESLQINNGSSFPLQSGDEIEMRDDYILVNSMVPDNQNQLKLKIEKFLVTDNRLGTINQSLQSVYVQNPVGDFLDIRNAENAQSFELFDISGKRISATKNFRTINTSAMPKGNYILKITFPNGETIVRKLLKN